MSDSNLTDRVLHKYILLLSYYLNKSMPIITDTLWQNILRHSQSDNDQEIQLHFYFFSYLPGDVTFGKSDTTCKQFLSCSGAPCRCHWQRQCLVQPCQGHHHRWRCSVLSGHSPGWLEQSRDWPEDPTQQTMTSHHQTCKHVRNYH